jgi:hypothetical protein
MGGCDELGMADSVCAESNRQTCGGFITGEGRTVQTRFLSPYCT